MIFDDARRRSRRAGPLLASALLALLVGCSGSGDPQEPVIGGPLGSAGVITSPTPTPPSPEPTTAAPPSVTPVPDEPADPPASADGCTLDDLEAAAAPGADAGSQRTILVTWTNVSAEPCTTTGFGGVDLAGPEDPTYGPTYSLPRTNATPQRVDLAPGDRATSTITYLPGDWTPTALRATPPNETRSAELAWPGGGVLRQDGATRPGTFLGPVEPGAG